MTAHDGHIVSIWAESHEAGGSFETLVEATPQQAREMAAHLIKCADALETQAPSRGRSGS